MSPFPARRAIEIWDRRPILAGTTRRSRHCPSAAAAYKVATLSATEFPCMARDQIDMTPVETRDELVAWLAQGSKPKSRFRIGTEHEKFAFAIGRHEPVPYDGPRGIRALLDGMGMLLGWEPILEGENIIGLLDVTGGGAI